MGNIKPIHRIEITCEGEQLPKQKQDGAGINLLKVKNCAVLDFDGTLRSGYTISAWLKFIQNSFELGYDFLSEFDELLKAYQKKNILYEELVVYAGEIYADACLGIHHNKLEALAEEFVKEDTLNIFPYTSELFEAFRESETSVFVVSGAPELPLKAYSKYLGIDEIFGLRLATTNDGECNGNIKINFGTANNKYSVVSNLAKQFTISVAIGDAESDWPILKHAKHNFNVGNMPIDLHDGRILTPSHHTDVIRKIRFNIL